MDPGIVERDFHQLNFRENEIRQPGFVSAAAFRVYSAGNEDAPSRAMDALQQPDRFALLPHRAVHPRGDAAGCGAFGD